MSRKRNHERNGIDLAVKTAVAAALRDCDWNIAKAAKQLDISRTAVWRWARKFKLMKPGKVMVRRLVKA